MPLSFTMKLYTFSAACLMKLLANSSHIAGTVITQWTFFSILVSSLAFSDFQNSSFRYLMAFEKTSKASKVSPIWSVTSDSFPYVNTNAWILLYSKSQNSFICITGIYSVYCTSKIKTISKSQQALLNGQLTIKDHSTASWL